MKKGLLIGAIAVVVIALTCSIVCIVSCNGDEHTHGYTLVAEVPSTCETQGTKAHYTCDGCNDLFVLEGEDYVVKTLDELKLPIAEHTYETKAEVPSTCKTQGTAAHFECSVCNKKFVEQAGVKTEITADALVLPLGSHNFTSIQITANPTKMEYATDATLDLSGMVVKKVCSTEGCDGETASAEEIEVVYGSSSDALAMGQTEVTVQVGELTATLSGLTVKTRVELPQIDSKTYTGETLTADLNESEYYDIINLGGKDVGEYDVVLKIKDDKLATYTFDCGSEATLKFTIVKADNVVTAVDNQTLTCADIEKDNYGLTLSALGDANVVLQIADEGGVFCDYDDFTSFPVGFDYTAKAVAEETTNYNKAESATFTITFKHVISEYKVDEEDATKELGYCCCGEKLENVFNLAVTATNDLVMVGDATLTLSLEGISDFATLKSLTYGEAKIVNSATETMPTIFAVDDWLHGTHGVKEFTAVVTDSDGFDHTIKVPVTFITGVVNDWTTFLHTFQSHSGNYAQGFFGKDKYYILGSDIEAGAIDSHTIGETTYNKQGKDGIRSAEPATFGFSGILDGRGHVVKGVQGCYQGIFGVMKNATVMNIDFTVNDWVSNSNPSSLFGAFEGVTFENINILFEKALSYDQMSAHGVITGQNSFKCSFKDINIYAPGSELGYLVGQGYFLLVENNVFTNLNFYVKSYDFALNSTKTCEGINVVDGINDYEQVIGTVENGEGTPSIDVVLPAEFADYTVTDITYNGTSVYDADSIINTTQFLSLINNAFGSHTVNVTLEKDGHVLRRLPMKVRYVTEVITSWEQLLYRVQYRSDVAYKFGEGQYYVLGNDIVGGRTDYTKYSEKLAWYGSTSYGGAGFAGTLDGAGHKITGIQFSGTSIFGTLFHGTVKNVTFEGTFGEGDQGLLGGDGNVQYATVENVTFKLYPEIKEDESTPYTDFTGLSLWGLLARNQVENSTFTNMTIYAEGFKFKNLSSQGANGVIMNSYNNAVRSYYYNCAVYADDYLYMANSNTYNYSSDNYKFYSDVQTIELTGDTVSIALPTVMTNGQYYAFRVILNGKELTTEAKDGKTETIGGTLYNAVDMANLSVEQIKEAIGDNYDKEYEIKFAYSPSGWNYALTSIVLRVKFTQPTSSEAGE